MKTCLVLLLVLGAGHASIVMAQSAGSFTATGNLTTARSGHSATLLTNGKVLIAGGSGDASAELYYQSTGTFTPTGNMGTARSGHTATLLSDGTVLIAGGIQATALKSAALVLASAELYDPSTGTFTATGDLIDAQVGHTATLLGNGKVLIAGGQAAGPPYGPRAAELYDTAARAFAATGTYAIPWGGNPAAVLLADRRVIITWSKFAAELYYPSAGTFSLTGTNTTHDAYGYTATLLPNGKVLVAGGGFGDYVSFARTDLYDASTGTFTATANMIRAREEHTATLLADGTVLIAGGSGDATSELYDPSTGTFTATGSMTTTRWGHTATLLADGEVLIAGGFVGPTPDAETYKPPVLRPAPALLSLSGDGRGRGAIQHANTYQVVSADNPAGAGEALVFTARGSLTEV